MVILNCTPWLRSVLSKWQEKTPTILLILEHGHNRLAEQPRASKTCPFAPLGSGAQRAGRVRNISMPGLDAGSDREVPFWATQRLLQ